MAQKKCSACDELRNDAPNFVLNGIGDTEVASLKNNTGLNPSSGNDDCTDLNNMNDCLIANMESEVEAYSSCEWKPFAKTYIRNEWTVFKGIVASICGVWTNLKNLWTLANKLQCQVDYLFQGAEFKFGEGSTDKKSYIVAGKGASFANVSQSGVSSDITITYVAGGLCTLTGSLYLYDEDFTDALSVYNYDNGGVDPKKSKSRQGNPEWNKQNHNPKGGSQLAYEIRIYKPEFPQIKRFFGGIALNQMGGGFHANISRTPAGRYAGGQNGGCDDFTGAPRNDDSDPGHLVPEDWEYLQVRVSWIESLTGGGHQYTPRGLFGVRMNQDAIDC